jgi:hypothetical protein
VVARNRFVSTACRRFTDFRMNTYEWRSTAALRILVRDPKAQDLLALENRLFERDAPVVERRAAAL